jgi:pyruvate formate lyase activating enzyme
VNVKGFLKSSLIDFPEEICSVLFVEGCNLRCRFCHNTDLIDFKDSPSISFDEILHTLLKRKKVISAVVISGGEPTLHNDLLEHMKILKQNGFKLKLDTNGSFPDKIEKIIDADLINYIALDIKTSPSKYEECTGGQSFTTIKTSLDIIRNSGIHYEIRTTCVPGLVNIEDISIIGSSIGSVKKYFLQQFRNDTTLDPSLKETAPYSKEDIFKMQKEASRFAESCIIRGL